MAQENPDGDAFELVLRQATGEEGPVFDSATDFTNPEKINEAVRRAVEKFKPKAHEAWEQLVKTRSDYVGVIEKLAKETGVDILTVFTQWVVQRELFLAMGKHFKLENVLQFPASRPDCVIALTRNSSIVTAGVPNDSELRACQYVRIDARKEGWDGATSKTASMDDAKVGESACFGDWIRTSKVECMLVLPADRSAELDHIIEETVTHTRGVTQIREV